MFKFKLEPDIPLLTVTRTGRWTVNTVVEYENSFRQQLALLKLSGEPRSVIVDMRSAVSPNRDVTKALRAMGARLGHLHPDRIAVVSSAGVAKLQVKHLKDADTQIFTSMAPARKWIAGKSETRRPKITVHDNPSAVEPDGVAVHVHGPSDVDILLSPAAALETAKRMSEAAVDVIIENARNSLT